MTDENLKDQLVTVPKLARLLAKDRSFIYEIGLDEFKHREIVQRLELILGFVLAMYNTAKSIFKSDKYPTLDDKFIELIYSRIHLMPEIIQSKPRPRDYAKQCYTEVKRKLNESEKKWEAMTLYEQFFEICDRVFIEELKLDRPEIHLALPDFEKITSRSVLACAFKAVFSHINWGLDDKAESTQVSQKEKVILSPKKEPGPESRLKEYPLLYLYFDNFDEITSAWSKRHFEAARHDSDIRSCRFSLDEIMRDENLFLELYTNKLVRLRLWDGTVLIRDDEEFYWDRVTHPEKYTDEISQLRDPEIIAWRKKTLKDIDAVLESIKLRYGLTNSDKA